MASPRFSILLPARNAAGTLETCLKSIRRQTEHSWECVIVDDGSTDATGAIARRHAVEDGRIHVISTPARGLVAALNEGLACCSAPLVARMDADDVMRKERLRLQADALERDPTLWAVGCHVRLFPRGSVAPRLREYEGWLNGMSSADQVSREAFIECPIAHPTMMMRRDAFALVYRDAGWPEDYDLVLRALAAGRRIGVVSRRLLAWRNGPGTLSRTDPRYAIERFAACKAHYLSAGFLSRSDSYILCGYGNTGRLLRQELEALGKTPSRIVEIKAGRIGQRIHGAPVIPYADLRAFRGEPILVSVARAGPRAEVRRTLSAMGFVEGVDYLCTA